MPNAIHPHITALSRLAVKTDKAERRIAAAAEKRLDAIAQQLEKLSPLADGEHADIYRSLVAERDKLNRIIAMSQLHIGESDG